MICNGVVNFFQKPTKEQIKQCRQAVIDELKKLPVYAGMQPANYNVEIEVVKNYSTHVLENAMQFNTPKEYAKMLIM